MNLLNVLVFALISLPGAMPSNAPQTDSHSLQLAVNLPALQQFGAKPMASSDQITAAKAPTPPPAPPPSSPAPPIPAPAPKPAPRPAPGSQPVVRVTPSPAAVVYPGGTKFDWFSASGISSSNWNYVDYIIAHESGWNPNATNPASGAHGLPQALPYSKTGCGWTDAVCQLRWANSYAISAYGSWYNAYQHWLAYHDW